jgi:multiple sugar transport system ATP-binding protein
MTDVRLEGVSKRFGGLTAVSDVDLSIKDGEFFVLLGPSGCGKSTTLRMVAGLESVTEGDIHFDDAVVTDRSPAERDIAMVFQNYALYPHKTVFENIAFPLELSRRSVSSDEVDERVRETAKMLQIEDQLDKRPKNLSGGQQQRVALGRSIIREPSVFLMDEPLSNLDAKLRIRMRSELKQLHERLNITTVYVTHDQEEAMSLADRIGLLNEGTLQQVGSPREVFDYPRNTWVAGFIGNPPMNLLDCSLDHGAGLLRGEAFEYAVEASTVTQIHEADTDPDDLVFGVRPMDLEIVPEGGPRTVDATVQTVEPTGERTHLTTTVGATEVTVETENDVGDELRDTTVHLRPRQYYVYDDERELLVVSERGSTGSPPDARDAADAAATDPGTGTETEAETDGGTTAGVEPEAGGDAGV